jgi:hypothetical protein
MSKQKIVPYKQHGISWDGALLAHLERDRDNKDEAGLLADLEPYALRLYILIQIRVAKEWETSAEHLEVDITNADARTFAGVDDWYLGKARRAIGPSGVGLVSYAPVGTSKMPRAYRYRVLNPYATRVGWDKKHPTKTKGLKNTPLKRRVTPH